MSPIESAALADRRAPVAELLARARVRDEEGFAANRQGLFDDALRHFREAERLRECAG